MVNSCNMATKFILLLMISTFLKLPNAVAMPSDIIDKDIFINIVGNEFHGNNNMFVNGGSNGLVENQKIMINQNISTFRGNNLISVNENVGSNIKSDTTFQVTATQSEDKTLEITAIPSEGETFAITAIPSQDKTLEITAFPSEVTTLVIGETTSVPTTELPVTTLVIGETTSVPTTELPECPSQWSRVGDQCFHVVRVGPGVIWSTARNQCGGILSGADLAQPKDLQALSDYLEANGPSYPTDYWLGGSKKYSNAPWRWNNGSDIVTGWAPGRPSGRGQGLSIRSDLGANSLGNYYYVPQLWFICEQY